MTTPTSSRASRPAILIAHGAFGRSAVERLLSGAALRGRLDWRAGAGGDDERRLRDLSILWWPDDDTGVATLRDGSSGLELMRDLDRQILTLDAAEEQLGEAVETAAARLLSAAERARRDDALPLGLDLIVLARPRRAEILGRLDRVLLPALERLAAKKPLRRGVQGADKLGFL
ncbi:MAG: hypothetical protein MI919_05420, partial [Holophagales bacterium]|nr:hypothetical protein [Holophagales bacterium]